MKKFFKILLVLILIVIVAVITLYNTQMSNIVTTTVKEMGPKLTQSEVTLDGFTLRLLRGQATLEGFTVGNPEGYKTPTAMELGRLHIDLEPKSLLGDTIHIKEILIDGPKITMEMGLGNSNIGKIQENIQAFGGDSDKATTEEKPEEATASDQPAKKVIIDNLYVKNGTIRLSAKILQGKSMNVPLPEIHLQDIGKEKNASLVDVIKEVTGAITKTITGAATGALKGAVNLGGNVVGAAGEAVGESAKAIGGAAKDVGGAAVDGVKNVGGAATEAVGEGAKAIGGAAKDVGGAAVDGVKNVGGAATEAVGEGAKAIGGTAKDVGGAAVDGVKNVGGAAAGGVKSVVGGLKGLVPGGEKEKK